MVKADPPNHQEMPCGGKSCGRATSSSKQGPTSVAIRYGAGELGAEVIALEPAKDAFALLVENVALDGYTLKPIEAADLLAKHGYGLYRPDGEGKLLPTIDTGFGPDIFAGPHG